MPVRLCRRPPDAGSSGYAAPGAREDRRYFGRPCLPPLCDLCAFDPDGPHCVAACPTKALTVMGGAADRELDEAKRLRSIENGPSVDVTAVAQGLSEKAEGSVNNG